MLRRHLTAPIVLGTVVAAIAAFSLVGGANGGGPAPARVPATAIVGSGFADERPTASFAEPRSGTVEAAALDRTERLGEVGRNDSRAHTRHPRTPDWAIALVVTTVALAALSITIARRRAGRTAVRIGRVAPARAPPLSIACT